MKLIDAARVKRFGRLLARRWVVKDLAQFWYSTTAHEQITDQQRDRWLLGYAGQRQMDFAGLRGSVLRKAGWIARHDTRLRRQQPGRNISIPR